MFVGSLAGMVGFRTHTFTRIGSIMDKKQPGSTKLAGLLSVLFQNVKKSPIFSYQNKSIKYFSFKPIFIVVGPSDFFLRKPLPI